MNGALLRQSAALLQEVKALTERHLSAAPWVKPVTARTPSKLPVANPLDTTERILYFRFNLFDGACGCRPSRSCHFGVAVCWCGCWFA